MEKTFTPKPTSNYQIGPIGLVNLIGLKKEGIDESRVGKPSQFVIGNILNYARSLEVLRPKNNLVFYFVKN